MRVNSFDVERYTQYSYFLCLHFFLLTCFINWLTRTCINPRLSKHISKIYRYIVDITLCIYDDIMQYAYSTDLIIKLIVNY